jgi:hypothetical protein
VKVLALGAIVVLVLVVGLTWALLRARADRRWAAAAEAARWTDAHEAVGGVTRVLVRRSARLPSGEVRVLGESVIDEVPDGDPDWHGRFDRARQAAVDRAIDLNGSSYLG